jgi:hypothetical protein
MKWRKSALYYWSTGREAMSKIFLAASILMTVFAMTANVAYAGDSISDAFEDTFGHDKIPNAFEDTFGHNKIPNAFNDAFGGGSGSSHRKAKKTQSQNIQSAQ